MTRRGDAGWPAQETLDGVRVAARRARRARAGAASTRCSPAALRGAGRASARATTCWSCRGTRVLGLPGPAAGRALGKRPVVLQPEVNGEMSGEIYTWGTRAAPAGRARGWSCAGRGAAQPAAARCRRLAWRCRTRSRRELLAARRCRGAKVVYIPHGVDTRTLPPADAGGARALRESLGLPADALVVIYTGRLLRGKGLETPARRVRARVGAASASARLVLVGSGAGQALSVEDELRSARRAAAGLAGPRHVRGPRGRRRRTGCGPRTCSRSRRAFEALGLSLIEAAACGLPCVGSRTGGIVDVIEDGRTGCLVPPGDAAALAGALALAAGGPGPARRRSAPRRRAIACERFDLEDSVDRYRALLLSVAAPRASVRAERAARAEAG